MVPMLAFVVSRFCVTALVLVQGQAHGVELT